MGMQRETASRGSLAMYTSVCLLHHSFLDMTRLFQVIFAVVFELVVFHTTPSTLSIAGTVLITGSAIYTSVLSSHFPRLALLLLISS
jgi:drug/metabolite transporter (DMT)-like permease